VTGRTAGHNGQFPDLPTLPDAACKGTQVPDVLFPPSGGRREAHEKAAKAVCDTCTIRTECLEWALEHRMQGVWGGLTDKERRRLLKGDLPGAVA
jgi:WhiB family redox-sensing transcriptional regulator